MLSLATAVQATAPPPDEQRTFVSVSLNGEAQADTVVVLSGEDVWLPYEYLQAIGLQLPQGRQRTIEGRSHVALGSLAPSLTFHFDEQSITLALSASAEALGQTGVYAVGRQRPSGVQRARNSSFFVNYAATGRESGPATYAGELGISMRGALLSGSVAADGDRLLRGPTRATLDSEARLLRMEIGDTIASSGALGDGIDIAGISVARRFDIDPYFVAQAPLSVRGAATTPSTADVYVNGQLVRRVPVAPGTFELTGLTAPIGAGQTQVVVRDAFGREQRFQSSFYQPMTVLEPGLHQFRYTIGVPRLDHLRQWDYGDSPVATGEHRYGLGRRVTIGGRFEAARDLVAGGPAVALALPIGELEAEAAVSRIGGVTGRSALLAYRYQTRAFSAGIVGVGGDREYTTLASTIFDRRRNRLSTQTFAGTSLGPLGLTASHVTSRDWDGNRLERADLLGALRLTGRTTLTLNAARNRFGAPRYEGFASLSITLGRTTVANLTVHHDDVRGTSPGVTMQRSIERGPSYGYQMQWNADEERSGFAVATLQHQWGRIELRHDGFEQGGASATLSGAIVGVGGRLFATRPVNDAFALVRIPDRRGVRVYSSNQLMGRTNGNGDLVVPDVISYYGNSLAIDPADLPLTLNPLRDSALVAPSFRAGGVALFGVATTNPVVGRVVIVVRGATIVPASGDLFVVGAPGSRSPIGNDGGFFFDTLPAGPAKLIGRYKGRAFTCDVRVPAVDAALIRDLGLVRCVQDEDDSSPGVVPQ